MKADVSLAVDVKRMVAKVEANLCPVDVLINNAGIAQPRKREEITGLRVTLKNWNIRAAP